MDKDSLALWVRYEASSFIDVDSAAAAAAAVEANNRLLHLEEDPPRARSPQKFGLVGATFEVFRSAWEANA